MTVATTKTLDRASFLWVAVAVTAALLPVLPGFPPWLAILLVIVLVLGVGLNLRAVALPGLVRLPLILGIAVAAMAGSGFSVSQDTGAALLAAMLASKLLETGSVRDGRSACSFALFALMAGFLRDQGPTTLLVSLLACVLIVAALARLARIQLPGPVPPVRRWAALVASAKLLAVSLPFAFAVFLLFPRFPAPLWGAPGSEERSRSGLSDQMSPGDIAQMLLDDSPALRITFEGETPPRSAMYWRGPVLSDFDGRRWSRWDGSSFRAATELRAAGPTYFHEVMQEPTAFRYLIGLDVPMVVPDDTRMSGDHTVYARRVNQSLQRFRIGSVTDYVLQPELPAASRQHHLALPHGYNSRTKALLDRWKTEDARPEALIQRALALFNAEFVYSLSPPPLARDSVDDFLFGTREGYCEHFASAFAVMMRSAGIPARVVTGYQGGTYNRVGQYWLVRNSDAHAWTEVWLQGRGWVRVDPTAAVAPERIREGLSGIIAPPGAFSRFGQPLWDTLDTLRRGWNYLIVDFDAARQRALFARFGLDPQNWRQIGMALAIGIALALTLSFALLWRGGRRRDRDPLLAAWARFNERLVAAGVTKRPDETASALLLRATRTLPDDAATLRLLIHRYVSARYAAPQSDDEPRKTLIRDLRRFRPRTAIARRTS